MEEIIGLLIVVATFIFKVVGKKLENSAHQQKPVQEPHRDPVQKPVYEPESEGQVFEVPEVVTRQVPAQSHVPPQSPVSPQKPKPQVKLKPQPKSQPKQPVLREEAPKKKEKIDLRKMIVYSEIMSPKYKNNNF